jgi:hypothetical protein
MVWDNFRKWDEPGNFFETGYGLPGYARVRY